MVKSDKKIRVLIAKPGLDGHETGAKVIARGLMDEGMEVIYIGMRQTPEQIVKAAVEEDVDVIGLSCLTGAHNTLFPRVVELLRAREADRIMVIGGGIIPKEDIPFLQQKGIEATFGPGSSIKEIVKFIKDNIRSK